MKDIMVSPSTIICFSYLASVHTLHVDRLPPSNYGVDVLRTDHFLAGDAPLVAGMLTSFGQPATLVTNQVAEDPDGRAIQQRLREWRVNWQPGPITPARTRVNIVICDNAGSRTWFSGLRGIATELAEIDLKFEASPAMAYIDCYEVLGDAPSTVVAAAMQAGADVILNLGGSPPPAWLHETLAGRRVAIVQTNADEYVESAARRQLDELRQLDVADLAVVTAGRRGAVAAIRNGPTLTMPAVQVVVRQVQGAGAAFSAGLIDSTCRGDFLPLRLAYACAAGSLWCARTPGDPFPRDDEIRALMRSCRPGNRPYG